MKSIVLISLSTVCIFTACDVRRHDKVVDDTVRQTELALLDTTAVQLIDSVFDFGKIAEGEKVAFNFRFKNIGSKPLVVTNASASCGCTVPEKPEKPVLPGETSYIKVVFDSKNKPGHQEKAIFVTANVKPEFPTLKLKGEVEQKVKQ
jgi:hypothetical protein